MNISLPSISSLLFIIFVLGCTKDTASNNGDADRNLDTTQAGDKRSDDTSSLYNLISQYEPPGRVIWQKPELIIEKMGDISNKVVADIGAGSGFFSRRLAQHAKKAIAIEVDPRFIHFMDSIKRVELSPQFQARLETRLATPEDSNLRPGEADIVLIVNTYIYFKDRVDYLSRLKSLLPKGGRIIIVDFKKKRLPISYPPSGIRLELYEVENELGEAGFTDIVSDDCSLDYQYVVIATK